MKIVDNLNNLYRTHFLKYSRREKDRCMMRNASKTIQQSLNDDNPSDDCMSNLETPPLCPPIFEGDYWVVDYEPMRTSPDMPRSVANTVDTCLSLD